MMDDYKVKQLQVMLEHETSANEEHYGARLSHWFGDTKTLTIDAGGLRALIKYYSENNTDLDDNAHSTTSDNEERKTTMDNAISNALNQAAQETEVPESVWENIQKRIPETNTDFDNA